jgi:hypothetical protein
LASSAASLYAIYGDLGGKYSDEVTENLYKENQELVAALGIFLYYAKDVTALLFAAIAASCAASAICEKENSLKIKEKILNPIPVLDKEEEKELFKNQTAKPKNKYLLLVSVFFLFAYLKNRKNK